MDQQNNSAPFGHAMAQGAGTRDAGYRVCVLNGSPKGEYSITLQTLRYLEKRYPACRFDVLHVGHRIKAYEKDMTEAIAAIESADLLLFCYPVYTFIAPYQLHRFIELLKRSGASVAGKPAAQITTSKHFYDVTAHGYIRENCHDMGLKYIGGLSADMEDLLSPKGRADTAAFWDYALYCASNDLYEQPPRREKTPPRPYQATLERAEKKPGYDTVILTNREPDDEVLAAMIADFEAAYPYPTRVINVAEYPFAGGCLGCLRCASDGKCVYRDGFDAFLRERVQTADAIVHAFTIRDHSMGASFKRYDDRQFCNGHRAVTMGMPVGYIVNGDYQREENLRLVIHGRCEVGRQYCAGVANDADGIVALARRLAYALESKLCLPHDFLGVGGEKIFRDLIYTMRGLMREDDRFFRRHGMYDFPQKRVGTIIKMKLVGCLLARPAIRAKLGNRMNESMIAPYKKAIAMEDARAPEG